MSNPSQPRTIQVVVTCTDRKTRPVPPSLRARSLTSDSLEGRLATWTTALESSNVDPVSAEQLYAGDHWQIVRGLSAAAPAGIAVETWVCSAGYGLIRPSMLIRPYAATFEPRHLDSVTPNGSFTAVDWWEAVSTWQPGRSTESRTVADLVLTRPKDFVLVAVSGLYARALSADLQRAAKAVSDTGRLAVISSGGRAADTLARHVVPTDARLKGTLGGAMQSLNARIARRAIVEAASWYPSQPKLASLVQSWLDSSPELVAYDRTKLDDNGVRAYIRRSIKQNPHMTHTRLLRALRDSGQACEQGRFAMLFREVLATTHAGDSPRDSESPSASVDSR